jgi:hypothetical protein
MDGRVQLPVINFLREHFGVAWVDAITEPGPIRMLADHENDPHLESIDERLMISVQKHDSVGVAVVGHHDCAGNPVGREEQAEQTRMAVRYLRGRLPDLPVIGLWVDESWEVSLVDTD